MRVLARTSRRDLPVFTRGEVRVLLTLYRLGAFDRLGTTWLNQVVHESGMSSHTVMYSIKKLKEKGLIQERVVKQSTATYMRLIWLTDIGKELAGLLTKLAEDP